MAHNDCLQDVPDIFENEIGESLNARTEGLQIIRELGPPDLCHIVKVHSSNKNEPDIGSYHHVLGVDVSSSASLAAYINSLQYSLSDTPGWFGANNSWKIVSGTYSSYNAFSNVDVRVQVKIPGGVEAYIITAQGERRETTEQMWRECYISAVLRAILYSDPTKYSVTGLRRLTVLPTVRDENRFVEAIVQHFWAGWALGSNAETQAASSARNLLVDCVMRYFNGAGRLNVCAAEILAPLAYSPLGGQQQSSSASAEFRGIDPEIASLLADAYIGSDEEVQGVRVLHQALKVRPSCFPLLHVQAEFLRSKQQLDSALTVARMAIKYAPSEFQAWAKLTEIYIDRGDLKRALLTLNTCPMYTYVDHDYPRVPTPRRINFPVKSDILAEYDLGEYFSRASSQTPVRPSSDADAPALIEELAINESSILLKLSATTLKGTFARAYRFLTEMASIVGWDELLRLRSQAFVMEDEYRNSSRPSQAVDDENEDEDDDLPLAEVRMSNLDGSLQSSVAAPATATDDAPVDDQAQKDDAKSEKIDDVKPENGDDSKPENGDDSKPENGDGSKPENSDDSKPEDAENSKPKDVDGASPENVDNANPENTDGADSKPQDLAATESKSAKKGKKKRKGKKKSRDNLKEAEPAPEPATKPSNETTDLSEQMEEINLDNTDETPGTKIAKTPSAQDSANGDTPKDIADNAPAPSKTPEPTAVSTPQATAAQPTNPSNEDKTPAAAAAAVDVAEHIEGTDFVRKRLCERWLDNLIMILFDDLRAYTVWRSEMHNLRITGQPVTFRHTQAEWEALGDLSLRLHHPTEAREAYEYALNIRFSARAWQRLLELYSGAHSDEERKERERNPDVAEHPAPTSNEALMASLDAVVWLAVYHDRWYNTMVYPNPVCEQIVRLVRNHGLSKVQNTVISMNLKPAVSKIVVKYLAMVETFAVEGSSW